MKKRLISFLLVLVLVVAALPLTAMAYGLDNFANVRSYPAGKFYDVTSDKWFYDNVKRGYESGLIDGRTEDSFGPDLYVTLAETVKLAACLHSIYHTGSADFVQGAPWYDVYFDYLIDNDVFPEEFRDTISYADEYIPRSLVAYVFWMALPDEAFWYINNIPYNSIPDVDFWHNFCYPIYELYRAGILAGKDESGTFEPDELVLRSEVATILSRIVDKSLRKSFLLFPPQTIAPSTYEIKLSPGETYFLTITVNDDFYAHIAFWEFSNALDEKPLDVFWYGSDGNRTYTLGISAVESGYDYIELFLEDEYGNEYGHAYITVEVW